MTILPLPVSLIILAAGASTRMGRPKQLLLYRDRSLLHYMTAVAIASGCQPIVVVLGAHAAQIRAESGIESLPVQIVENPQWYQGMGSSIQMGLTRLQTQNPITAAVVITLCDQPLISPELIQQLVEKYYLSRQPIAASEYTGTVGVPALFSRALFSELLALDPSAGAKQVIQTHLHETARVPFPEGAIDLDTLQDYEQFLQSNR